MAIVYVGIDDPRLRIYSGMTDAQLRECYTPKSGDKLGHYNKYANGLFIAESKNVIQRAMAGGYKLVSVFMEEKWLEHETPLVDAALALDPETPILVVSHEVFKQLTGYQVTRGALAAFERKPLPTVEDICRDAKRVAVLEDVTNYTNIGAIFRSAAALGMDAVLLTPGCSDPLYRRSVRVSMGTVFQIPWAFTCEWPEPGIALLKEMGFRTVSFALRNDSVSIDDPVLLSEDKLALILGTEGEGLKDETMAKSDYTVKIPMYHDVDSLNVAAASAVAFYELGRSGKK